MSADVIDFYTRQRIPQSGDLPESLHLAYAASAQEFNAKLAVWPDFSRPRYEAPPEDCA